MLAEHLTAVRPGQAQSGNATCAGGSNRGYNGIGLIRSGDTFFLSLIRLTGPPDS